MTASVTSCGLELFAARDKDEWEFLKYQMKILKKMFHGMYPSSQTPLIRLIFTEHHIARADPNRPCSDILSRARMMDYLKRHEARGGIQYQLTQAYFQPWAGDFVKFGMRDKSQQRGFLYDAHNIHIICMYMHTAVILGTMSLMTN